MSTGLDKLRETMSSLTSSVGKQVKGSKGSSAGKGKPNTKKSGGGAQTADDDLSKLTRLQLLEILVDQRKEIDHLKEKLAETTERLERDDALIKKYLLRESSMTVRREIKDE